MSKLQKKAEAAMRKFNEESAAATSATSSGAEASGTAIPQAKFVPQKPKASKPKEQFFRSSSVSSTMSSETKSSPTPLKTTMTAGRGIRPSPSSHQSPSASEGSDEFDDETLQAIIRNKQECVARASGSAIPLAMDPNVLLDYINVWYDDPNTPIHDLKLPPGIIHMVATFINEAKWKEMQTKQAKAAKLKKEKFLRQNLLNLSRDDLVSTQAELKTLTDKYTKLSYRQSLKSNFINFATNAVDEYNKKAAPPAKPKQLEPSYSVQLTKEDEEEEPPAEEMPQESHADEPVIEEISKDVPADESMPADESAPDEENASAEETVRSDTAQAPEEKIPSPQSSKVEKIVPSASDVKKTKAAEKESKKRKAS
ncbi:hypothetical protein ZWY2020_008231 [Hordeum vulgare]|nr:hypothetical protein ZWY2020_008231 [Hordeum vulgare]